LIFYYDSEKEGNPQKRGLGLAIGCWLIANTQKITNKKIPAIDAGILNCII